MKAVKFKHCNIAYAENQEEYETLHGLKLDSEKGEFIFCMKLSFWERLRVLFLGRIWVSLLTFNSSLTPSFISTNRIDHYSSPDDPKKWFHFWKWLNY